MTRCDDIRDRFFAEGPLDLSNEELASHLAECERCALAAKGLSAADAALSSLPKLPVPMPVPSFDRLIPHARAATRSRQRVRTARRMAPFFATAAAAAVLAIVVSIAAFRPKQAPLAAVGSVVETATGSRAARLSSGAHLTVEGGRVAVTESAPGHEELVLQSGTVSLEVPHLKAGSALSVRTPDALVTVHGTRFRVAREGPATRVSVTEGLVEVVPEGKGRETKFLHPGESTLVESLDGYRARLRSSALTSLERGQIGPARAQLGLLLDTEPSAEQSADARVLLAGAAAAEGDRGSAIREYRRALQELPAGATPLWADNAAASLALLLEQEAPSEATAAWRDYIARFPQGLHAELARTRLETKRDTP